MRQIFAAVLALAVSVGPALADPLEDVIIRQLEAFNDRDAEEAFTYASPMIKRLFGTPENFGNMLAKV